MDKAAKPQIKQLRELLREKKARDQQGVFVAEGLKIVSDILSRGHTVEAVFLSSKVLGAPSSRRIEEECGQNKVRIYRVPAEEFEKLSSLRNSQGVLALVKKPRPSGFSYSPKDNALLVLCDGVQDPGNLGAIIRTSAAFNIDAVFLFGDTADIYNPKVVRSSSGAILEIPIHVCDIVQVEKIKAMGCVFLGSSTKETPGPRIEDLAARKAAFMVAFGSEGRGLSKEIAARIDEPLHIPVDGKVESLNVTAAAAIALYMLSASRFNRDLV
jgi:RNA methyltransferase, TrmH family